MFFLLISSAKKFRKTLEIFSRYGVKIIYQISVFPPYHSCLNKLLSVCYFCVFHKDSIASFPPPIQHINNGVKFHLIIFNKLITALQTTPPEIQIEKTLELPRRGVSPAIRNTAGRCTDLRTSGRTPSNAKRRRETLNFL